MTQDKKSMFKPPRFAEWIIQRLVWTDDSLSIKEDLREEYEYIHSLEGDSRAKSWYWRHILRSIFPFLNNTIYWSITMFKNYLRIALRNFQRQKSYTVINVLGLALGMACCVLIFLFVRDELSYDRYHDRANQIYRIIKDTEVAGVRDLSVTTPPPMAEALVRDFPEVIDTVRFISALKKEIVISSSSKKFYERRFYFADQNVFDVFTFPLVNGNSKTALQEPYSIVITEEIAQKYFGTENPLGKVLTFNNSENYTITGVLKNIPSNSHFRFDFLASFATLNHYTILPLDDWGSNALYTYLYVQKNFSRLNFEKKLPTFIEKYIGQKSYLAGLHLQPLTSIHLYSHAKGEIEANSDIVYIYIFTAIALLILVLACINFINLSTARHMTRAKEVGIRKVLGAFRFQIMKQFLGESLLLSLMALPISIILVELFLPLFNSLVSKQLAIGYFTEIPFLLALLGVTALIGLASGVYPSLYLSNFQPVKIFRGTNKLKVSRSWLRNGLVLFQFAVSVLLITCTFIMNNQLNYVRKKKLGFDKEQVVVLPIKNATIRQVLLSAKNEFLQNPKIKKMTFSSDVPGQIGVNSNPFLPEGYAADNRIIINNMRVDTEFISTLELEIKEGRPFTEKFLTDKDGAFILNEAAVQKIGWDSPIGKQLTWYPGGDRYKNGVVIGVMKDFHYKSFYNEIDPLVLHIWPASFKYALVKVLPGDVTETLAFIKEKWIGFIPNFPFTYSFLDEDFDKLYKSEQRLGQIFLSFSFISIFIACLGLFGLTSFATEQRRKEVGIRKILGASIPNIVLLFSKEYIKLVMVANVIAWPIAYYMMNKWLQNFAYRINIVGGLFVLSAGFAVFIAFLTVGYLAIKSAFKNPIDSLRYE